MKLVQEKIDTGKCLELYNHMSSEEDWMVLKDILTELVHIYDGSDSGMSIDELMDQPLDDDIDVFELMEMVEHSPWAVSSRLMWLI